MGRDFSLFFFDNSDEWMNMNTMQMYMHEGSDKGEYYFYICIHFSWNAIYML